MNLPTAVVAATTEALAAALLFASGGVFLIWRGWRDHLYRVAEARAAGLEPRRRFSFDLLFGMAAVILAILVLFGFGSSG